MKVLDLGHLYAVRALDSPERYCADGIRFVKRIGDRYPGNQPPAYGGTNCQEVLRVLINRAEYLDAQIPCAETKLAIANMQSALFLFEARAARVHNRSLSFSSVDDFERAQPCDHCLHIGCEEAEMRRRKTGGA